MPKFKIELRGKDLGLLDIDELSMEDAMQLEDQTGLALGDVGTGLGRLSARALQAIVWLRQRQLNGPSANLHDNFKFGEVKIEQVDEPDPTRPAETGGDGSGPETNPSGSADGGTSPS